MKARRYIGRLEFRYEETGKGQVNAGFIFIPYGPVRRQWKYVLREYGFRYVRLKGKGFYLASWVGKEERIRRLLAEIVEALPDAEHGKGVEAVG